MKLNENAYTPHATNMLKLAEILSKSLVGVKSP